MVKLLIVSKLESMDVPSNFEGLTPIEYASQEDLIAELTKIVTEYLDKMKNMQSTKPSKESWDEWNTYLNKSEEEVDAIRSKDPRVDKMFNDIHNYSNNFADLCYNKNKIVVNGIELDLSNYIDEHSLEMNLPEVLTFDQWFESRLDRFKPKTVKNKM